jgi:hypothetical protein
LDVVRGGHDAISGAVGGISLGESGASTNEEPEAGNLHIRISHVRNFGRGPTASEALPRL